MEALVQRHAVILAVLAILLGACAPMAGDDLPVSTLRADAASQIAPPGAETLLTVQAEPFNNITGHEVAFYGHIFGVQASADDVHAYYVNELGRLGWRDALPVLGTTDLDGWAWCKSQLFFNLAIIAPRGYSRIPLTGAEQYRTVVDARIQGSTQGCSTR